MKRLLFLLVGIIAIGIGIFAISNGNRLAKVCTEKTTGTVVGILREEEVDSEGYTSIVYRPQIEYKAGEQLVSTKGDGSSNASDYNVDDKIDIMYNPNNVEEYMIKGDNSSNVGGIMWIVLGVIIALVGVYKILTGR